MAVTDKPTLQTLFQTGDKPTQTDFLKLIDSCWGIDQQVEYLGNGIVKVHKTDGTFQIIDLSALNKQTLSYDPVTRTFNLTLSPAGSVGPLKGIWRTNGANCYQPDGNVGVGTDTPQAKLHVIGTSRIDGFLRFASGAQVDTIHTTLGNTHTALPTEQAVKTYVDSKSIENIFLVYARPNIPYGNGVGEIRVHFNGTAYDPDNYFGLYNDPDTNRQNRFIAPSNGYYLFNINLLINPVTAPTFGNVNKVYAILKTTNTNINLPAQYLYYNEYFIGNQVVTGSVEAYLDAGDSASIFIKAFHAFGGVNVVSGTFSGKKLKNVTEGVRISGGSGSSI